MTKLSVVVGDITTVAVDGIVNAANSSLMGGGGVDGAIHRAGGPAILDACRAIVARQGSLSTGDAVITGAGRLSARHVIHTVGPVWTGQDPAGHDELLAKCYRHSLDLAASHDLASVAFPNISTGVYRFPKDRAAAVAVGAVREWVAAHDELSGEAGRPVARGVGEVIFVCFDDANRSLYEALVGGS